MDQITSPPWPLTINTKHFRIQNATPTLREIPDRSICLICEMPITKNASYYLCGQYTLFGSGYGDKRGATHPQCYVSHLSMRILNLEIFVICWLMVFFLYFTFTMFIPAGLEIIGWR